SVDDSANSPRDWQSPKIQGPSAVSYGVLEALPGRECGHGLGVDLDFLAVGRAAAGARLALARQEGAEPDHGDAVALGDAGDDRIEHRVDRFSRRGLAQIPCARRSMNKIRLRNDSWHARSPLASERA